MKNLKLNLKGLCGYRQSLLPRSPQPRDNREMSERRPSEERTLLASLPQRFGRYAAMLFMLLTLGLGQMWGADGDATDSQNAQSVTYSTPQYIYTPNLSTQDTLILKHQDTTPAGSWWQRNGWNFIQAALLLVLGAMMSLITGQVSARIERKKKKQEMIEGKAIEVEEKIYQWFVKIRNAADEATREKLLLQVDLQLNEAELTMRTPLYLAAVDLRNFYTSYNLDDAESTEREEAMFAKYKTLYRQNNG